MNKTLRIIGSYALEAAVIVGSVVTTGYLSYFLATLTILLLTLSCFIPLFFLIFLNDPVKWLIRINKDTNTIHVDNRALVMCKDCVTAITNRKWAIWLTDALVIGLLFLVIPYGEALAVFLIAFSTLAIILREVFVEQALAMGPLIEEGLERAVSSLEKVDNKATEEKGNE